MIAPTDIDLAAAQRRIRRWLTPSPTHYSHEFGCWLKLESLQQTGSYKVRGALNAVAAGLERGDRRCIVAASAGNHARGLAWAASRLGVEAIVVMPTDAPQVKVTGAARLGAKVVQHGDGYDQAKRYAEAFALERGLRLLSAFDDPDVIAGQATVGLELNGLDVDTVLVPIGGGGLAAGVALALRTRGIRMIGVQVAGLDAMRRALNGDARPHLPAPSVADGVRVAEPGRLTRQVLRSHLDDLIVVDEAQVRAAMARLLIGERLVAEGAGVIALAAAERVPGTRKCAIVSGGNVDASTLIAVLGAAA